MCYSSTPSTASFTGRQHFLRRGIVKSRRDRYAPLERHTLAYALVFLGPCAENLS